MIGARFVRSCAKASMEWHRLLAFIDHDAFQCGFCTPGQLMSAVALLREGHARSAAEIREWMSANLCRCASYLQIVSAVEAVASHAGATDASLRIRPCGRNTRGVGRGAAPDAVFSPALRLEAWR